MAASQAHAEVNPPVVLLAHHEEHPEGQQGDPGELAGRDRVALHAERAELVDDERHRQLRGDRRGHHRPGAQRPHRDEHGGDVYRAEDPTRQVPPRDARGLADPPDLAADGDEREQGGQAEREGDARGGERADLAAEAPVDRRLKGDKAARGGGGRDGGGATPLGHWVVRAGVRVPVHPQRAALRDGTREQ